MKAPEQDDTKDLLADAYRLLREAEYHLEKHAGFARGTGKDGAFLARSAELRERMSGAVDLRLRRIIAKVYGRTKKRGAP